MCQYPWYASQQDLFFFYLKWIAVDEIKCVILQVWKATKIFTNDNCSIPFDLYNAVNCGLFCYRATKFIDFSTRIKCYRPFKAKLVLMLLCWVKGKINPVWAREAFHLVFSKLWVSGTVKLNYFLSGELLQLTDPILTITIAAGVLMCQYFSVSVLH